MFGEAMNIAENTVSIRKMKVDDADAISDIYSMITQNTVDAEFKNRVREHAVLNCHEAPFVAELNGKVIGFMISYIVKLGFEAEKSAYIATMGIHPQYMGQSIGACLIREVSKFYKSQGIVRVYTSVRWDAADILSFFKTVDFGRSNFINLKRDLNQLNLESPQDAPGCRQRS